MKKLHRSKKNKIFGGLLGGVGEYFNIDPVIVRIVFIFALVVTEIIPGVLVYILGVFVVPEENDDVTILPNEDSSQS